MATVDSVLVTTHGLSSYTDYIDSGRDIRQYEINGKTPAQVRTAAAALEAAIGDTVTLGGVEPDIILLVASTNETLVVR